MSATPSSTRSCTARSASRHLSASAAVEHIFVANGDQLVNPDWLEIGQVLHLSPLTLDTSLEGTPASPDPPGPHDPTAANQPPVDPPTVSLDVGVPPESTAATTTTSTVAPAIASTPEVASAPSADAATAATSIVPASNVPQPVPDAAATVVPGIPAPVGPPVAAPPVAAGPVDAAPPAAPPPATGDTANEAGFPTGVAAGGLALAGLVALVDQLRRRQQRHRRRGRTIRMPDPETARVETALRGAAALDTVTRIDIALRTIGCLPADDLDLVALEQVRVARERIELTLTQPVDPPAGWEHAPTDPTVWSAPLHHERTDSAIGRPAPFPALVALGVDADAGDEILIDLERIGTLAIDGDPTMATAVVQTMAIALSTSPWADALDVVLVGLTGPLFDPAHLAAARADLSLDTALAHLADRRHWLTDRLDQLGVPSVLAGRVDPAMGADWDATIVVTGETLPPDTVLPAAGFSAVVAAGVLPPGVDGWQVTVDADGIADIPALGSRVRLHRLDREATDLLGDLVATVADANDTEPADTEQHDPETLTLTPDGDTVQVRLLGPVSVTGPDGTELATGRRRELVALLTLHREGLTSDEIRDACWGETGGATATFNSEMSRTRRTLGRGDVQLGNQFLLPVNGAGRYQVSPTRVTSDWDDFRTAVADAGSLPVDARTRRLREALNLINGELLSGDGSYYHWTAPLRATIADSVVDTAMDLAELELDRRAPRAAEDAARSGLRAVPYDQRFYEILITARAALGDPAGVQRIMDEAVHLFGDDGLIPELVLSYQRATGDHRGAVTG